MGWWRVRFFEEKRSKLGRDWDVDRQEIGNAVSQLHERKTYVPP